MMIPPLALASASPRRLELLQSLGLQEVQVMPASVDETPHKGELPSRYALRVAHEKAQWVHEHKKIQDAFILSADTIVALGRRIFQKARDVEEARAQMLLFSGRRHRIYTGLCLITPEGKVRTRLVCTRVALKRLSTVELDVFLQSREWEGVCGYRLQGLAGAFVSWINGTPSNILGLPVYETAQLLIGNGYPLWDQHRFLKKANHACLS